MTSQTLNPNKTGPSGPAKWSYPYVVHAHERKGDQLRNYVVAFMFRDTAERFAKAVHGTLWLMRDVSDYTQTYITTKSGREPVARY